MQTSVAAKWLLFTANDDTDEVLNNIAIPNLPKHFLNFLTDNS